MVGCATRAKCSSTNQNAHDMHVAYDIKPEFKSLVIGSTHGIPKSDHYTKQYFLLYIGNNLLLIRQSTISKRLYSTLELNVFLY